MLDTVAVLGYYVFVVWEYILLEADMGYIIVSKLARLENDGSVSYGINSGYRISQYRESFAAAKARLVEMQAQYPKSKHVIKAA